MQEALAASDDNLSPKFIHNLIATLEFLSYHIEGVDPLWKQKFFKYWEILEQINATPIDQKKTDFSNNESVVLEDAIKNLKALVAEVNI